MREREVDVEGRLDLVGTFRPLSTGHGDPTWGLEATAARRASRTPVGPGTLELALLHPGRVVARGWGPGADWLLERVPDMLGSGAPPPSPDRVARELRPFARRAAGIRLPRTHRVVELLVPLVLQQKVAGKEAARAHRHLVRAYSEPAPGPFEALWLPLGPAELRSLPAWSFPPLGVSARQGELLRRIGQRASRLEEADAMSTAEAERRLRALPGIGPWTAAEVLLRGMGCGDAVPVGDYHLPSIVAFNLRGEARADDARMLELLEPYRGYRGWAVRWIEAAGRTPPRRGPRRALRGLPMDPAAAVRLARRNRP